MVNNKYIREINGKFKLYAYKLKGKQYVYIGTFDTTDEAIKRRTKLFKDYPRKYKEPSPKGISYNKKIGKYTANLRISSSKHSKNFVKHIRVYNSVKEAYDARLEFI